MQRMQKHVRRKPNYTPEAHGCLDRTPVISVHSQEEPEEIHLREW